MTKRKSTPKRNKKQTPEVKVDNFARFLQVVAIIGVVAVVLADTMIDGADVPVYVPAGLMGVAVGLSPDQFINLIKALFGRGK